MTSCAWLWVYAGAALMLLEVVAPGFILCFFGLSVATVGVLKFAFGDAFAPTGDSEWTAEAERPIEAGANVRVVAQQNLTMKVEEV